MSANLDKIKAAAQNELNFLDKFKISNRVAYDAATIRKFAEAVLEMAEELEEHRHSNSSPLDAERVLDSIAKKLSSGEK